MHLCNCYTGYRGRIMSLPTKINWTEAQKTFLSDPTLRYKDIADKYGVSLTAVKARGANESWHELRSHLSKKTIQQVETKLIDRNSGKHWQPYQ